MSQRRGTLPRRDSSGFTLIEILIVVAIIAIIAAIAVPMMLRARLSANEAAAIGDLRSALAYSAGRGVNCASPPPNFMETKSGYIRGCTPGTSYWLTPAVPGKTGIRGFAGEPYGRICVSEDGTVPTMPDCTTLK